MMAKLMRAIVFERVGGPEVLQLKTDVPIPKPAAGQALVREHAAGVNPVDFKVRSGLMMGFAVAKPKIPGGDLAGVVEQGVGKGDKVFALTGGFQPWSKTGTYAEYSAVKEKELALMPAGISFEEAAGIPLAALTAYQALDAAGVREGTRVLVHAGAGGVGSLAVQLAKARRAYVITTAGTRNIEFVTKELGADEAIDYTKQQFDEALKGSPVDAVIDMMGGDVEARSFRVLKRRGHYQRIANEKLSPVGLLFGMAWGMLGMGPTYGLTIVHPDGVQLQKIADLISQGKVKPVLDKVFPLEQAAEAHRYLEQGHARGKVVLRVRAEE